MGWYGSSIGKFTLLIHDSSFDFYLNKNKPKEWYENKIVHAEFKYDNNVEDIDYPLVRFGGINKLKKYYRFELHMWETDILTILLLEEIKKRDLKIVGDVILNSYNKDTCTTYFLKSPIGDDNIILTNKMNSYPTIIETKEDIDWIYKNNLDYTVKYLKDRPDFISPYCSECTGCGEEGCCSPLMCGMSPNGEYCTWYLRDLKYTYNVYNDIMDKIYNDLTNEQKNVIDSIVDNNIVKWYKK